MSYIFQSQLRVIFIHSHGHQLTESTEKSSHFCKLKMVSPKLAVTIAMASVPFFLLFASEGASSFPGSFFDDGSENGAFASQNVNLSVYYESLYPSCATFIIKNLGEIFNNDLINIVNLHLVPWGNAYINNTSNSTILCQNGPDECELNSIEACALNVWQDVNKQYALIYCIEFLAIEGRQKNWRSCFSQLGLPEELILNCYSRGNGTELGRQYVNETAHLYPPHTFLPWVVVNNQPIGIDYGNFTNYVCKAYKGVAVPAACNFR